MLQNTTVPVLFIWRMQCTSVALYVPYCLILFTHDCVLYDCVFRIKFQYFLSLADASHKYQITGQHGHFWLSILEPTDLAGAQHRGPLNILEANHLSQCVHYNLSRWHLIDFWKSQLERYRRLQYYLPESQVSGSEFSFKTSLSLNRSGVKNVTVSLRTSQHLSSCTFVKSDGYASGKRSKIFSTGFVGASQAYPRVTLLATFTLTLPPSLFPVSVICYDEPMA